MALVLLGCSGKADSGHCRMFAEVTGSSQELDTKLGLWSRALLRGEKTLILSIDSEDLEVEQC